MKTIVAELILLLIYIGLAFILSKLFHESIYEAITIISLVSVAQLKVEGYKNK